MSTPPALSGTALELVTQFLQPSEIGRARITCLSWKDDLNSSKAAVWKQAALNVEPAIVQAVMDDVESREEGGAETIDFYRLALGLRQKKHGGDNDEDSKLAGKKREAAAEQRPTFRIEDLLIVVEIKRKIQSVVNGTTKTRLESLGAFSCGDCSRILETRAGVTFPAPDLQIQAENPLRPNNPRASFLRFDWMSYRRQMSEANRGDSVKWRRAFLFPITVTAGAALHQCDWIASVFFVRRDDWRTFLPFQYSTSVDCPLPIGLFSAAQGRTEIVEVGENKRWEKQSLFAQDETGTAALTLIHKENRLGGAFQSSFRYQFETVPAFGSNGEPAWLHKVREAERYTDLNWTREDEEEACRTEKFQFRLSSVSFGFYWTEYGNKYDVKADDLLLVLGGLDWHY